MGLSDLLVFNQWTIIGADPEIVLVFNGQFQPKDGVEINATPNLAGNASPGSSAPVVTWVNGAAAGVVIRGAIASGHQLDDKRGELDTLIKMTAQDATLGRAPLLTFTWGDVVVTGFGSVKYKVVALWSVTGWPRLITYEIEILPAPTLDWTGTSGSGETQYITLAEGEGFEALGLRFYGDPLLGELIRRENPALAEGEGPGDVVKVLEREHPRAKGPVAPTSPPFLDRKRLGDTWQPLVAELAETRGVSVPGLPWELQPDVLAGRVTIPTLE